MDELSEICAGTEPGFCQEAKNFNNPLVEMIKKNKGVRTNLKKKVESKSVPKPLGMGKNQLGGKLSLSLFPFIPVQEVGLPSPSVSQIKWLG